MKALQKQGVKRRRRGIESHPGPDSFKIRPEEGGCRPGQNWMGARQKSAKTGKGLFRGQRLRRGEGDPHIGLGIIELDSQLPVSCPKKNSQPRAWANRQAARLLIKAGHEDEGKR